VHPQKAALQTRKSPQDAIAPPFPHAYCIQIFLACEGARALSIGNQPRIASQIAVSAARLWAFHLAFDGQLKTPLRDDVAERL
jgi:hypothetical protein